ncbi:MAG TPA: hypothetical protein PKC28_05870 [Bdellovibrionales bacterium]|nr:hypothetical protein [Bdellovibrionales bacterium]
MKNILVRLIRLTLIATTILSRTAFAQKPDPACEDLLLPLPRIRSQEIKNVEIVAEGLYGDFSVKGWRRLDPDDSFKFGQGVWNGQPVFFKALQGELPDEAKMLRTLNTSGIGPKALATFRKGGKEWLVMEFVEGELYRPIVDWGDCIPKADEPWDYHPNRAPMPGCHLSEKTFADVEHAFAILDHHGIAGNDIQFLITPEGRAILIDTGYYRLSKNAVSTNAVVRAIVIEGLEAAAILQFRPQDDPYRTVNFHTDERFRNEDFRQKRGY